MAAELVESIEKDDPSEDTLQLATSLKKITKPGDYRFTEGQWRIYTPPKTLRAEQKRIEVELIRNEYIWQKWKITAEKPRRRRTEMESSTELLRKSETRQKEMKMDPVEATPNIYQTGHKNWKYSKGTR